VALMASVMTARRRGQDLSEGLMTEGGQEVTRVDRIGSQVSSLHPGRALLSGVAGALWLIGFVVGLVLLVFRTVLWTIPAWCFIAVRLGMSDALRPRSGGAERGAAPTKPPRPQPRSER
jgi:hypothetical protein